MSDRVGRFNTIISCITFTIIIIFAAWFPFEHSLAALYVFVSFFGFGTGSFVSLGPVCLGQICRTEEFGRWYGSAYFVVSFAYVLHFPAKKTRIRLDIDSTLINIPIGGAMLQAIGSKAFIAFLGGVLALGLLSLSVARWACLDYNWKWKVKI